jgi:hypothetical protein
MKMLKTTTSVLAAAMALLVSAAVITAADKPADGKKAPATTQAAKGPAVNKFCAVEGGDHTVDPDFYVIYKGQKIGFCCADCIKEFDQDPDEYIAKMKARNDFPKK